MEPPRRQASICYMSLADAFVTRLRQEAESRTRSRMGKGVRVEVLAVERDRQAFIHAYLTKLYEERHGTFSKPKTFAKQTIYECERSNPCKGSSSGDPTKTRANGCSAYVSFLFEEGATVTACVVRCRLTHTGHDPNNREESRVSRIDLKLRFLIETQLSAGMKVGEVMSEVTKWNKAQGYTDHRNRRYFPTRHDIHQMALTLRKPKTTHDLAPRKKVKSETPGKEGVSRVLRTELRDWCVFYQARSSASPSPRPLIVVVQSEGMREAVRRHGTELLCVDKNFEGLREYGSGVYVVAVRDEGGGAHPGAYIVTSDDQPITFLHALRELHARCPLHPRVVMVDQEIQGFSEVLTTLLPHTLFIIPFLQVAQETHQWLGASQENTGVGRMLLQCLQELRACDTKEAFVEAVGGLGEVEASHGELWAEWLSHPTRWSDFGRGGVCGDPSLSPAWERFFLRLQQQFLKGFSTQRTLPDLLRLITHTVTQSNNASNGLLEVSLLLEGSAGEQAASLIKQGWAELLTWQGEWVAHVPCHTLLETSYCVNVITMECECPLPTLQGPCVHLSLASTLAERQGSSVQQERQRLARAALDQGDYLLEGDHCVTFHSGGVCVTETSSCVCTCVVGVLDSPCVGVLVVGLARDTAHTPVNPTTLPVKVEDTPPCQEPPIIIQTHTGLPHPYEDQNILASSSLSSKALLENLYLWSTSKDFTDSNILHNLLQAAHDSVWGCPSPPTTPTPPPAMPRPRLGVTRANKKLRAVVRPVVREEEDWAPPCKVTRSGRTVRVKDEQEYVS